MKSPGLECPVTMQKDLEEGSGVLEELEGLEEVLEGLEVDHTEQCLDVQELHYIPGRIF